MNQQDASGSIIWDNGLFKQKDTVTNTRAWDGPASKSYQADVQTNCIAAFFHIPDSPADLTSQLILLILVSLAFDGKVK